MVNAVAADDNIIIGVFRQHLFQLLDRVDHFRVFHEIVRISGKDDIVPLGKRLCVRECFECLPAVDNRLALGQTALELALFNSLTVLALFLSYAMLNVCDLSTDGCYALGAAVGAVVAIAGHPWLSIPAAMGAGMLSGLVTAVLQTRMGVNSLLAGIIVNTGLYSVNIWIMRGSSLLNMNKTVTVFTMLKETLKGTPVSGLYAMIIGLIAVAAVIAFQSGFLVRAIVINPFDLFRRVYKRLLR